MPLIITRDAVMPPGLCAASASTTGPFVDTGHKLGGRHIYLSVPYLQSIAPGLGLVPAPELATALEDLHSALTRVDTMEARVRELQALVAAQVPAQEAVDKVVAAVMAEIRAIPAPVVVAPDVPEHIAIPAPLKPAAKKPGAKQYVRP